MKKNKKAEEESWIVQARRLLIAQCQRCVGLIPVLQPKPQQEMIDDIIWLINNGYVFTWIMENKVTGGRIEVVYPHIAG